MTPDHYQNEIQAIDIIESHGLNFSEGNVIKYVLRWRKKGGVEDLKKAKFYLERLIAKEDAINQFNTQNRNLALAEAQAKIDANVPLSHQIGHPMRPHRVDL